MQSSSNDLFRAFKYDLAQCAAAKLQPPVYHECCIRLCTKYWLQLREKLRQHVFKDIAEEINFFREIKPRFLTETEYFSLLAYSQQFCPVKQKDKQIFWEKQQQRLDIFKSKHAVFYQYLQSGRTDMDAVFFTAGEPGEEGYQYDNTKTGFDLLIAQLRARERYADYALQQMPHD